MKYQVGGSLRGDDPTYVVRQADAQIYAGLKAGDFCYVLNCRQIGKSSLLHRTRYCLETEGYTCVYLDLTRLGSEETTPLQWYKGVIVSLFDGLNLAEQVNFKKWWEQQAELSPVQRLHQFIEQIVLPVVQSEHIFIFIDEIDSLLSLSFPVSDFFAWIRHCYNMRADNPDFNRLGFALFGVASPSDLIADKRRTPFNIGQAIELHGFQLHEAIPLLKGLEATFKQPAVVLREIIHWTGGQPFLTQKLCQLVQLVCAERSTETITIPDGAEAFWVEQLVKSRIIQHWESLDEPEHFRTIRDRLLFNEQRAGQLLAIYQKVLQAESAENEECSEDFVLVNHSQKHQPAGSFQQLQDLVPIDDSRDVMELLLSGLVEKHNGYLRIKNPIYLHIFNAQWVVRQLDNLRPYSQAFNAWVASNYKDESRLLRGQALKDASVWAQGKSLGDLDYKFLVASQELDRQVVQKVLEAERALEVEARLAEQQKRLVQERKANRLLKFLVVGMTIKFLLAFGWGITSYLQYQSLVKSEQLAKKCLPTDSPKAIAPIIKAK
jgi:hypothetical protein